MIPGWCAPEGAIGQVGQDSSLFEEEVLNTGSGAPSGLCACLNALCPPTAVQVGLVTAPWGDGGSCLRSPVFPCLLPVSPPSRSPSGP